MLNRRGPHLAAILACAGLCSAVAAQPKMIITGIGSDLAGSGNGVAGLVNVGLNNANSNFTTRPMVWSRGAGYTMIPGAIHKGTHEIACSADLGALAMGSENLSDWGSLNCFEGYNALGVLNPPSPPPCTPQAISHRWTAATGWVNTGSFPRFPDPITGRLIGGTRCDFDINEPNDISGNGRYLLGSGWYARATTSSGGVSAGLCGNFYGFRYDGVTGAIEQLPVQPGSTTSRADVINFDGSVITGYDLDSAASTRRLCVWRDGVQTILDPYLGAKDNAAISGPGNVLATGGSLEFVSTTFGQSGVVLVRWIWGGGTWIPENLGRPADYIDPNVGSAIPFSDIWATGVSDDGNTIVGIAQYGAAPPTVGGLRRPFIWNPAINGGVPMDFEAYIASIGNPQEPIFPPGLVPYYIRGISGNGNAVMVLMQDQRNTCIYPSRSHVTFNAGIVYLNGSGIACDAPRIGQSPESWAETGGLYYGVSLNVVASGSWPLNYQWQREDPAAPGTWINLQESCQNFSTAVNWDYEGVYKNQLRIGSGNLGEGRGGRYRVVVSNSCGSVASEPATVTFLPGACCLPDGTCVTDFYYSCLANDGVFAGGGTSCASSCGAACYANCDNSTASPILNVNDFICFQAKFAGGDSYANCDNSTSAPVLNINDFICFQSKFAAGCP